MSDMSRMLKSTYRSDNNLTEYRNEDSQDNSLLKSATIATAATGAVLFGLGRTGALKYLSNESHLIGKSISDTASSLTREAPILTRLFESGPSKLFDEARGTFESSLASNRTNMGELFNGKTYSEVLATRAVQEVNMYGHDLSSNNINNSIINAFKDDIKDQDVLKQVSQYVGTKFYTKSMTADEIAETLNDEFKIGEEISKRISSFAEEVIENGANVTEQTAANKDKLQQIAINEMKNKLGTTDESSKSILTGYKRATIEDLLKAENDGRVKIGEKQKEFLQKVVDTAEDESGNRIGNTILADKHVYVDGNGKLIDMRTFPEAMRNFAENNSDSIPAKIFHVRDILYKKDTRFMQFFGAGTSAPHIAHLVNENDSVFLDKALMVIGSGVYDASTLAKLSDHSYRLTSSQYGTIARMSKSMFGMSADRDRRKFLGFIDRDQHEFLDKVLSALDIGNQEEASNIEKYIGLFKKAHNPNWDRNIIDRALSGKANKKDYDKISSFLAEHVNSMSDRTWSKTVETIRSTAANGARYKLEELNMRNKDEIEKAIEYYVKESKDRTLSNDRLSWILKQYQKDPSGFLDRSISVSRKIPIQSLNSITKITGYDIAKREIQKEIMLENKSIDFNELFSKFRNSGNITKAEHKNASQLFMFANFDKSYFKTRTINETQRTIYVKELNDMFSSSVKDAESMSQLKNNYANVWQSIAFNDGKRDKINTKYMAVRDDSVFMFGLKSKNVKAALKSVMEINNATKAKAAAKGAGNHVFELYKEFTAGRKRPQDVTTFTLSGYFFAERLNEHLGKLGLALSDRSMGSTAQNSAAYLFKRALPIMLGIGALNYADYRTETYTGQGLYSRGIGALTNMSVGKTKLANITGLSKLYKNAWNVIPYMQYWDEKGPMTAEEKKDYYEHGYTPVRRGRYWGFLSSTPMAGDTIEYWKPTAYRMIKSNYKYTSSLYGSKDEYWANSWMPTPAHPFAPIRHFITDRYHWENKHKYDRPYPLSAPLFEEGTPWGVILNPTIGKVIKPTQRYHREEMGLYSSSSIIGSINDAIKRKASRREKEKTMAPTSYNMAVSDSVAGLKAYRFVPDQMAEPNSIVMRYKYRRRGNEVDVYPGVQDSSVVASNGEAVLSAGAAGSHISLARGRGSAAFSNNLASINRATQAKAAGKTTGSGGSVSSTANAPRVIPGTMLGSSIYNSGSLNAMDKEDLSDLMQSGSLRNTLGDFSFSMKELSGIWGFFYDTSTDGGAPKQRRLANAGNMGSFRRSFWDESLGGLGGSFSEIFRRFVPRFGKEATDYNPIRNTMPLWMPSRFRTGDPYTKVKQGEARLPGGGYESLNALHPDSYGRYGAFDRFKILADIAPYSDEYKIWRHVAEQTATSQAMKDEMDRIKKRVAAQKQQHRFFSYKFKYSDIKKQTVTIAEILDKNTFLTHELPDTPIKMAGVDFRAEGHDIKNMLSPGQTVTIGYAKDSVRAYNKDTYRSLNAVVYSNNGTNLNNSAIKNGFGDEKPNDNSPAGIRARFSGDSIIIGKLFESMAHNDTIPGLALLNSKFGRVRSPLEEYERTEIYGKPFTSWQHPINSYLKPAFERAWSKGVIGGTVKGASLGFGLGVFLMNNVKGRTKKMALLGGIIGGLGGLRTTLLRAAGSEYIPDRVKKRREIEEYFDNIKYLKYRRLYEQSRKLAWKYEKVNVERMSKMAKGDYAEGHSLKKKLESIKTKMYVHGNDSGADDGGSSDRRHKLNEKINNATPQKSAMRVGKYSMTALMYKQAMESTFIGMPKDAPWINKMAALPRRERDYFMEFVDTPEEERKRLLRLVPKQEAEMLKSIWKQSSGNANPILNFFRTYGDKEVNWFVSKVVNVMKEHTVDVRNLNKKIQKDIELSNYFASHAMPNKKWAGWSPDVNLDQIKIKVMNHEGVDVSDAGYTDRDLREAREDAPPAFDIHKHSHIITSHITDILSSSGLSNVKVVAIPTQQSGLNIRFDMMQNNIKHIGDMIQSMFT